MLCAMNRVDAPFPHPMSATCAPASSFYFDIVNAGIHEFTRLPASLDEKTFHTRRRRLQRVHANP